MQIMAQLLGGEVRKTGRSEYGKAHLKITAPSLLLSELPEKQQVWMSHRDAVVKSPEGFVKIAQTEASPVAAFENRERKLFGVQFHPEVVHTPFGLEILKNFLFKACGCLPTWTKVSIIEEAVKYVREEVGEGRAICALSGGVDSSVAALLVHRAIGDRLTCVFVDHGLLRAGEAEQVVETFKKNFHINLVHVNASKRFLSRLKGVIDPEEKRKIVGEEFIRVFEAEAKKLGKVENLVQGTLYPDVIESGTREAARIKTHHNVGGLPTKMDFKKVIEPLRLLFKDEVRAIGEELGLPEEIVWRHPFPGPGLAIRIVGEVTPERLKMVREADRIVVEEIKKAGLYKKLWQAFAVLLTLRTVGVMGDERTYAYPVVVRAVTSEDAMTADWAKIPFQTLEKISRRIINEVEGVNRVAYDISSKPPSTIEWE
jgi:GMP synthase (glutamine-hydrolysing)